ncbi:hypothetical protein MAN_10771, partial [Metarhizium hybridum]
MSQARNLVVFAQNSQATYVSNCDKTRKSPCTKQLKIDEYDFCISQEAEKLASWLESAWPDIPLTRLRFEKSCNELELKYVNSAKTWKRLGPELQRLSQNLGLSNYVQSLEDAARKIRSECSNVVLATQRALHDTKPNSSTTWTTPQASSSLRIAYHVPCLTKDYNILEKLPRISTELSMLHGIAQPFKASQILIKQQYGQDLEDSIAAMAWDLEHPQLQTPQLALTAENLDTEIASVEQDIREKFGILVTKLQHLLRMHDAERCCDKKKLLEEQKSTGHSNWTPMDHPEWLLLEIDNNILIRPVQVEVAKAIISPHSNQNSVLQMNMGKGKTSVVMPMAALILPDKTKLCRIVVPKALLLQTAQVTQSRIGGLVGHQVRHVPFARRSLSIGM